MSVQSDWTGSGSMVVRDDTLGLATVRDELYGDIELTGVFHAVLDSGPMQRLRRINQLGLAYLVCPGAVHTRFAHSIGVYHLMTRAVRHLERHPRWREVPEGDGALLCMAGLVHDTQHYPSAHFLEEVGLSWACHEAAAEETLAGGELGGLLSVLGPTAPARIAALIRHEDPSPLANLLSGAADVDKLDYLVRDLRHTGYPVMVDQNGVLGGLTLVDDPATGRLAVGLRESALPAWETMLFAKYFLYRRVLFATPVRSATAMMRALVLLAFRHELFSREELMGSTDLELMGLLRARLARRKSGTPPHRVIGRLLDGITERRLYQAVLQVPVRQVPRLTPDVLERVERALAETLGMHYGEVLLDLPYRPHMLDLDLLVERSDGTVVSARHLGSDDGLAIHGMSEGAYHASSRATVYTVVPKRLAHATFWEVLRQCGVTPTLEESVAPAPPAHDLA